MVIFSVVIPCWNQSKFLPRAVRSVLSNRCSSCEVIIVNDGSPDNTKKVAEELQILSSSIKIVNKSNGGPSSARNAGLDKATGVWILCLDADDYLVDHALDKALLFIESNPDLEWFYTDYSTVNYLSNEISVVNSFTMPADPAAKLLEFNWMPVHSVFAKRELYDKFGFFNEDLTCCEDWDRWIAFILHGARISHLPIQCAVYVRHPDSLSSNYLRMIQNAFFVLANARCLLYSTGKEGLLPSLRVGMGNVRAWMFAYSCAPVLDAAIRRRNFFLLIKIVATITISDSASALLIINYIYRKLSMPCKNKYLLLSGRA